MMIGADLVSVGDNGETAKQTRAAGRPSWGRKKGNGRKWTYLYHDKWTCTSPSPRLCLPPTPSSRHFPFPFLSAVFTHTIVDWIVICPSPPHSLLSLRFALVSVTTCPCHLIFSHPPHTRPPTKRHQSHHPIPSPIYRSPHISLRILPRPPLTSSYLTLLTSPAIASILFRLPRTHLAAMCFKSAATASQL